MHRLKGKTILMGREATNGRLIIALVGNGNSIIVGAKGSVPSTVSRCNVKEGTAHCKIDIDHQGNMVLTNMKPQNVTYVDGFQIESKRITEISAVALGKDRYEVSVPLVVESAKNIVNHSMSPSQSPINNATNNATNNTNKTFSIGHLKKIWDDYEEDMDEIQRRQQQRAKRRMLPMMIGTLSTVASGIVAMIDKTWGLFVTLPIAVISFIIYFISYREKDTSVADKKRVNNTLYDSYICPNPECKKFLGNMNYKLLIRQSSMHCPYCKCNYVE